MGIVKFAWDVFLYALCVLAVVALLPYHISKMLWRWLNGDSFPYD